jgi:hypothetical protein
MRSWRSTIRATSPEPRRPAGRPPGAGWASGWCAALLLLSGCGSGGGGEVRDREADSAGAEANAMLANLAAPAPADDPARLREIVARAMPAALPDAKDDRYRNLRGGAGGSVCGEVAPRPATGVPVFRPFLINPDGIALVATAPQLKLDDPSDFFADGWIRWCATPEELRSLAPKLQQAAGAPQMPPAQVDATQAPATAPEPAPLVAAPRRPARPSGPQPSPSIDSFFNSVRHNSN